MPGEIRVVSAREIGDVQIHAEELLTCLQIAQDRSDDQELRRRLQDCVRSAFKRAIDLKLSEPGSRLGELMFFANRRAQERGWL